jgi:integron integrase
MDSSTSKPRLREQVRAVMRVHHYSIRTEKSYWYWIRYFIRFHQLRHPLEMGAAEVNAFLSWLAVERKVAAATQNLALNALVFLYTKVLQQPLGEVGEVVRAKRSARIPSVLTHAEATQIIDLLGQPYQLLASLMYGAGLRVVEAARLRIKDVDFDRQVIVVHDGKGAKDRTTLLPASLITPLLERRQRMYEAWKQKDTFYRAPVSLPFALRRKYPAAPGSFEWQWLFPSSALLVTRTARPCAIMCMSAPYRRRSSRRCGAPASISQPVATPFAIALPPNCCVAAAIFARCKRYLAMPMCERPRYIPMCWVRHLPGW